MFEDTFGTATATQLFGELFEEEKNWADIDQEQIDYIVWIRQNVREHLDELNGIIVEFAKGWTIERMNRVDVSILRLALCEIKYREDVNASIAINEAVEIAKKYSADEGPAFINGLLGAYVRSL